MPRIPYQPADIAEPAALIEEIRARRGGALFNLDRMLLHSPGYADGWNTFIRRLRESMALPDRHAELVICAVAVLNAAPYEMHHHAPRLLAAGASQAQLDALAAGPAGWDDAGLFDATERAMLALTRAMTTQVAVPDEVFEAARAALPDTQQMVELVGVIAAYNMVSRFLVALGIEPEE